MEIDFFEFSFLVEACIPPKPIARGYFWKKVIDKHYHELKEDERLRLFDRINRCYAMEQGMKNNNEDCRLFFARYNPKNQYKVLAINNITYNCFMWNEKYHISSTKHLPQENIIKAERLI